MGHICISIENMLEYISIYVVMEQNRTDFNPRYIDPKREINNSHNSLFVCGVMSTGTPKQDVAPQTTQWRQIWKIKEGL